MKHVTFQEYEAAKAEILLGVQYKEDSTLEGNVIRKTYATKENGVFYEVNDGGRIEFWSDKHPESRIYDENERAASPVAETAAAEAATPERVPGYGELLQEKIRTETKDFNALNEFEKFILNRGYLYDTEEELKAGYDRAWKASHGIMVTAEEFAAEIKRRKVYVMPLYVTRNNSSTASAVVSMCAPFPVPAAPAPPLFPGGFPHPPHRCAS
ncbi:hypothetical protein [Acutalibacter sp. JLR.KK004]|jgi:hypothetical protein|uniref:hypothetical protein n=1 Tax=Acutalibacter sp. JLR.KK004 TaxID=3112622 RepID=UPI002FF28E72